MPECLQAISKSWLREEVRITGTNQKIIPKVFLPAGNLEA
jgi:hypothetical protein